MVDTIGNRIQLRKSGSITALARTPLIWRKPNEAVLGALPTQRHCSWRSPLSNHFPVRQRQPQGFHDLLRTYRQNRNQRVAQAM